MAKKSKSLYVLIIILTLASLGVTFYKTIWHIDFEIRDDIPVRE